MWFGDLVTMRWWNDLWLNECFASYISFLALESEHPLHRGMDVFANGRRRGRYQQDQLPTTHPIVADIPDVESVHLNFDGITYAKGASVLQAARGVGGRRTDSSRAPRRYFRRHEFGNAELDDFLSALEEASGRDLRAWSKEWLEAAGVNTLHAEIEAATTARSAGSASSRARPPTARPSVPTAWASACTTSPATGSPCGGGSSST